MEPTSNSERKTDAKAEEGRELVVNRKSERRNRGVTPVKIITGRAQDKEREPLKRIENQESIDHRSRLTTDPM